MDRINQTLNVVVMAITLVAGGYMAYETSGFGFLPVTAAPDDPWFRATVLEQSHPVLVKFGASWCGPCRKLDPVLDRLAGSSNVTVVRFNIQQNRELARHYHVRSIPHLCLFHNGAMVAQRTGYADYDQLRKWVHSHVSHRQVASRP